MSDSHMPELEAIKNLPEYQAIISTNLKSQIKRLVEQLSIYAGEEAILLSASLSDGTLFHVGTQLGEFFLESHSQVKEQFLGFCIKNGKVNDGKGLPEDLTKKSGNNQVAEGIEAACSSRSVNYDGDSVPGDSTNKADNNDSETAAEYYQERCNTDEDNTGCDTSEIDDSTDSLSGKEKVIKQELDFNRPEDDLPEEDVADPTNRSESNVYKNYTNPSPSKHQFSCEKCSYSTNSRGNLYRHKQSVHASAKKYCPICYKEFSQTYDLNQHYRSIHENIKLSCDECDKLFNNRYTLRRHIILYHTDKAKYKCGICGNRYFDKNSYDGHLNNHANSKPYCCTLCNKGFAHKNALQRHATICDGGARKRDLAQKLYKCSVCEKVLKSQMCLKVHIKGVHGEKDQICLCGKSFSWPNALYRHKKICKINIALMNS